ncbi:MAG: 3-dehydroquinate synthase [Candidatus Marinimicrobia bacterium]|nr:3-dehydroquinate synthase [Candidatus Neomarinimicrobiota bacterium]
MIKKVNVKTKAKTSLLLVGESIRNLKEYIPEDTILIVDANVYNIYKDIIDKNIGKEVILFEPKEDNKSINGIIPIYHDLLEKGIDRSWFIVGIGGGITTDVVGFVASTYMRGLKFGFVSTTLLGQVDASVGGKNGVNFRGYKNIVGTINQPEFVICDIEMLNTLPREELINGFAEIIKYALIADRDLFDYLRLNCEKAKNLNQDVISHIVERCVRIKADIVSRDEKESYERRKLNFGHTIGHALERITGISHGKAISIGMKIETEISELLLGFSKGDTFEVIEMIKKFDLPVEAEFDIDLIIDNIKKDKKKETDFINLVLLEEIGRSKIKKISFHELKRVLNDLRQFAIS